MPVFYQKWIMRSDLRNNPDWLFVFGDNMKRVGMGGQAKEMRGEPNALGVATKRSPGMTPRDFFSDDSLVSNIETVLCDLQPALKHLETGGVVVIPVDGIGTGLSQLPARAPMVHQIVESVLFNLMPRFGVHPDTEVPRKPGLLFKDGEWIDAAEIFVSHNDISIDTGPTRH